MKNNRSFTRYFFTLFLLSAHAIASLNSQTDLIITAGSLSNAGFDAFYHSEIFIGDASLIIEPIQVYETQNLVFLAQGISPETIIKAKKIINNSEEEAFLASSFRGFLLENKLPSNLKKFLGVESTRITSETREVDHEKIIAFSKNDNKILWPKNIAELSLVPAVLLTNKDSTFKALVSARSVGHLANKLKVVEKLQAKNKSSIFIELGSNQSENIDKEKLPPLIKRNLQAMFLDQGEMTAI